jgi:hypothetical protein
MPNHAAIEDFWRFLGALVLDLLARRFVPAVLLPALLLPTALTIFCYSASSERKLLCIS